MCVGGMSDVCSLLVSPGRARVTRADGGEVTRPW
jgi:hypothetical protein